MSTETPKNKRAETANPKRTETPKTNTRIPPTRCTRPYCTGLYVKSEYPHESPVCLSCGRPQTPIADPLPLVTRERAASMRRY